MYKDFFDYFPKDKVKYWTDSLLTIDGITLEGLNDFKRYQQKELMGDNTYYRSFNEAYAGLIAFIESKFDYPESSDKYFKLSPDLKSNENTTYLTLSNQLTELVYKFLEEYKNISMQESSDQSILNSVPLNMDNRLFTIVDESTIAFKGKPILKKRYYKNPNIKTYFDFLYKLIDTYPNGCQGIPYNILFGKRKSLYKTLKNGLDTESNGLWLQLKEKNMHPQHVHKKIILIHTDGKIDFFNNF